MPPNTSDNKPNTTRTVTATSSFVFDIFPKFNPNAAIDAGSRQRGCHRLNVRPLSAPGA
jgi:hypothetical protein